MSNLHQVDEQYTDVRSQTVIGCVALVEATQVGILDFGHTVAGLKDTFPDIGQWVIEIHDS